MSQVIRVGTSSNSHPTVLLRVKPTLSSRVPTWPGKPGFSSQGKVKEKLGKITQNTGKLEISDKCYLLYLVIFKWTVYYLLKWMKFSVKKTKNIGKCILKNSTRMHSSRMRTGRSLTVCWRLLPGRGGVPDPGGECLVQGGSAPRGVSGPGGVWHPSMHWGRHPPCGQNHRHM